MPYIYVVRLGLQGSPASVFRPWYKWARTAHTVLVEGPLDWTPHGQETSLLEARPWGPGSTEPLDRTHSASRVDCAAPSGAGFLGPGASVWLLFSLVATRALGVMTWAPGCLLRTRPCDIRWGPHHCPEGAGACRRRVLCNGRALKGDLGGRPAATGSAVGPFCSARRVRGCQPREPVPRLTLLPRASASHTVDAVLPPASARAPDSKLIKIALQFCN